MCSAKIKVKHYISKQKVRIEWFKDSPDHTYSLKENISEQKVRIEWFKDSPDHTHSLEESEKIKHSQAIWDLVMQEVLKNYWPSEIINIVKEYAIVELDLRESVKELKLKEVINIKYKVRGSLDIHLISNFKWSVDIWEAISFLRE